MNVQNCGRGGEGNCGLATCQPPEADWPWTKPRWEKAGDGNINDNV